jgi:hypothetical protein
MKITIESTTKIVALNGLDCRVWEGQTEQGVAIHCFIPRISVNEGLDTAQFEAELQEQRKPSIDVAGLPARMIL